MKYKHIYIKLFIITTLFLGLLVGGLLLFQMKYFGNFYTEQKKAEFFSAMRSVSVNLDGKQLSQQQMQAYLVGTKNNKGISALLLYPIGSTSQNDYVTDLGKQAAAESVSTDGPSTADAVAMNILWEALKSSVFPVKPSEQTISPNGLDIQYVSYSQQVTINDSPYFMIAVTSLQPVDEAVKTLSNSSWLVFITAAFCSLLLSGIISGLIARPLIREIEHEKELDLKRREFISHASHELKTPISIISSYLESLLDNMVSGEERAEYEQIVFDETQKMGKLVRDMLEISWIQNEKFELHKTEMRLDSLIEKAIQRFSGMIKEKEIHLAFEGNTPTTIWADESQIEIVLDNLISNAIFHSIVGGKICISLTNLNHCVRFEIENEGLPIPDEMLNRIWESFFRVDKAHDRQDRRYGLGLSIVKASIEKHQGRMGVQNTPDGVQFFFELSSD